MLFLSSCEYNDERFEPHSFDELSGRSMSLMEGSIEADYCFQNLKGKDINYKFYPSISDCTLAVLTKSADVYFGNNLQIYNEEFRKQNLKICYEVDDIKADFAFGINKSNSVLLANLNRFIDSLSANGVLDEMKSRWFNPSNTDFHDCVVIEPAGEVAASSQNVFTIGISGVKQPAEVLIDNKWTGYEIELLQRYALSIGCQLKVMVFDFHNLIPSLLSNKVDAIAATLVMNDERKTKINFTHPVHFMKTVFIVRDYDKISKPINERIKESVYSSLIKENRWKLIFDGLLVTIHITIVSILLGSLLGALICLLRMSHNIFFSLFSRFYLYVMRNIPTLVFLMLMYYVFLANTGISPERVAIIAFSLNCAAFISEIFRTGILSVDKGQIEACRGLGCSAVQTFFYITVPQALKNIIPVFKNESIILLKSTSLVGYISIVDMTKASDLIRSSSFEAFFPLIVITILYFILATIIVFILDTAMKHI